MTLKFKDFRYILEKPYVITTTTSRKWNKLRGIIWQALMTILCATSVIQITVNCILILITSTKVIRCLLSYALRSSLLMMNYFALILFVKCSKEEPPTQIRAFIELYDRYVAKNKFHIRKRVASATNLAVIIYNDGFIGLIPIYKSFGITLNAATIGTLKKIDRERVKEDRSFNPVLRLEQCRRNRFERLRNDAHLTKQDPHKYGAGIAD